LNKDVALSKNFFKKNLKEIISFSIILFIATILFSSAIVLKNNVSKSYDNEFNKLSTANAFFTIPSMQYTDNILKDIKNIDDVKDAEIRKGIMLTIPVEMEGATQDQNQIFYNINDDNSINKYEIIDETSDNINNSIYLSNYTFIHSSLNIKDKYEFKVDDKKYSFNIKGVVKEMQYGNYTSSVIGEYLSNEAYKSLLNNNESKEVVTISIISNYGHQAYNSISKYLSSKNISVLNKNYDEQSKNQRLAISNILILILIAFSSVMLIVSLLVSKFKIEQSIEEEMANMGVLKALGYTSNEIIISVILPYIISGLLFTIVGIVISYLLLPLLSTVIMMQSGFMWIVKFDLLSNIIVLLINLILISSFTILAAIKIKKLNPINAIRGLNQSNGTKNHFEIEKTKGNIQFILMLKNFINTKKQNVLLGIVLFFITIVASFVGMLFYNINLNPINFINTLVEEHPSVVITIESDIKNKIKDLDNVKNVIYYDENVNINYEDNSYKTFISESFNDLANDLCYEGVNPKSDNEVAIGSKIKETFDINIGEYITLSKNGITNKYKVVGFVQSVNYSGEIIEMTLNGYKKLDSSYSPKTMYIYLDNENNTKEFISLLDSEYGSDIISTINYVESMDSAMNMYVLLISVICIVIIVITLLLIYLILYILISSIITKRKQELGIFKAIGYENKQLIRQLVGGFIPSTIISTILGFIISKIYISNIYEIIFKAVGAYKVSFEYPITIFLAIVTLLILSTLIIGILLSRKIKKISVYSLIKD